MVVLPAPDGPTSAVMVPGRTSNDTSKSTCWLGAWSRTATDSREASDTSLAVGYLNDTLRNSTAAEPRASTSASGLSSTIGGRSSTSKTRSKLTSAVITSTCTLDSAVSGP